MTTNELMAKIAQDAFPHGATLTCRFCFASVEVTVGDCAVYLRIGWPRCCGFTAHVAVKETA